MHETGIAMEIYAISRRTADANGGGRLTSVKVIVGELSAIEPDLLAFAWEAVTAGEPTPRRGSTWSGGRPGRSAPAAARSPSGPPGPGCGYARVAAGG